jgi:acetyl esterase/lipase
MSHKLFLPTLAIHALSFYVGAIAQFYFNFPVYWLKRLYNFFPHSSHDGYEHHDSIKLTRGMRYGSHSAELCDVMEPLNIPPSQRKGVILYVHGGGFICTMNELYYPSLTFLVRQGYTVIGVDYPLAPLFQFPVAVFSVLKASRFAKERFLQKHEEIIFLGDSAGANIIFIAAAAIGSPTILQKLRDAGNSAKCSNADMGSTDNNGNEAYPVVGAIISVYGMLCLSTCGDKATDCLSRRTFNWGLRFVWNCFTGSSTNTGNIALPATFEEVVDNHLKQVGNKKLPRRKHSDRNPLLPPTFFCVGDRDFLLKDSQVMCGKLKEKGLEADVKVYTGDHAFVGLPLDW